MAAAPAGAATWVSNPANGLWSNAANWGGFPPFQGDLLTFDSTTISTTNNDLAAGFSIGGINFNSTAPAYTLNGNAITLNGAISNFGTLTQTFNMPIILGGNQQFDPGFGGTLTFNGAISGTGFGPTIVSAGVVNMTGANTYTGPMTVNGGTVNLTGGSTNTARLFVATTAVNAVANVNNEFLNITSGANPDIQLGTVASGIGALNFNSGTITTATEVWLSTVDGAFGGMVQNGGVLTIGSWFALARGGGQGIYTQNGGTMSVTGNNLTIGSFGGDGTRLHAEVTDNGGVENIVNNIFVGEQNNGILNIMGNSVVSTGSNGGGGNTQVAVNASQGAAQNLVGELNLNGGTLSTNSIRTGTGGGGNRNAIINFNGGVLQARSSTGTFILNAAGNATTTSTMNAYIWPGGLTLDDQGFNLTIGEALQAPTGQGITTSGLSYSTFTPFQTIPMIEITGGGGTGATAVANINAGGTLTSITITNPGVGYTSSPTFTIIGGGGQGSIDGVANLANNGSGGLTKIGTGTLTLTGTSSGASIGTNITTGSGNTYTGNTTASGGLNLAFTTAVPSNVISSSSKLVFNNGLNLFLTGVAGATNSQTVNGVQFNSGPSTINLNTSGTANGLTFNMGAITRNPGSTVNVVLQNGAANAAGTVTTTSGSGSILGGYLTIAGNNWAGKSGNNLVVFSGYNTSSTLAGDASPAAGAATGSGSINSLRFNAAGAVTVDATAGLSIATGGILVTSAVGNNAVSINNGTVTSGNGQDLIVIENNSQSSLTINSQITGNIALTKAGPGTLILGNSNNTLTGKTYINGGTLRIAGDASLGAAPGSAVADQISIAGNGALQLGAAFTINSNRGITLGTGGGGINTNGFDGTYGGIITGGNQFTKSGGGVLTLTQVETYTGATTVSGGGLVFANGQVLASNLNISSGTVSLSAPNTLTTTNPAQINVGNAGGSTAVLAVSGGTLTAGKTSNPSISVGQVAGANGYLLVSGGQVTTADQFQLGGGNGAGAYANLTVSGGALTTQSWLVVGNNNDKAVFNLTGGSVTVNTNRMTIAAGGGGAQAQANISGGTFTSNGGIFVGEFGQGVLNMSGTGVVTTANIALNQQSTGNGIVNLDGGTITATSISRGNTAGGGTFNFNGGLLKVNGTSNQGNFMNGLSAANVQSGGAIIDDSGASITINQALLAPTGSGIASINVSGGTGYIAAPHVAITGGGGSGATAVANIDGTGKLTITVTNPGSGYGTSAPTVTLTGGNGSGATIGSITISPNTSGGLTKLGAGTVTLGGASTYTGATTVTTGQLNVTGSLVSAVTVNGGAFLGGSGTLNGLTTLVGGASAGARGGINLNNNTVQTLNLAGGLTVGSATDPSILRFDAGGVANASSNDTADLITINNGTNSAFTVNPGGALINVTNLGGLLTGHTYTLMSFNSANSLNNVTMDPNSSQLGLLQLSLIKNAGSLQVSVSAAPGAGATPTTAFWAGDKSANWATVNGTATNWRTDASSNQDTGQLPGPITNVVFGTTNPPEANLTTTLGANFEVKSITVKGTSGAIAINAGAGQALTVDSGGISMESGAAGLTIGAPVILNGSQSWNNASTTSPITANGVISGNANLTLGGPGTILLNAANTFSGSVTITGGGVVTMGNGAALGNANNPLNINSNGKLQIFGQSPTVSSLSGDSTATIENGSATNSTFILGTNIANNFGGTFQNGNGGGSLAWRVQGGGTLTYSGNSTSTGNVTVRQGTLIVTGSITGTNQILVGDTNGQNGNVIVNGGTISATGNPGILLGNATTNGAMTINSGVISTTNEVWVGEPNGSYGGLVMNGGTLNSGSWFALGRSNSAGGTNQNAGTGVFVMTGGDIEVLTNNATLGSYNNGAATDGVLKVSATISGGVFHTVNQLYLGENVPANITINGSAAVNADGGALIAVNQAPGNAPANFSVFNLSGGTLTTPFLAGSNGNGNEFFNAHGGLLRASATASTNFLRANINNAYLWPDGPNGGGLQLDDGGGTLTVATALRAPTGKGVATIVTTSATNGGYMAPPLVTITGGGGTGATAIANIDANGRLTSITVTNPGVDYTSNPTVTIFGGGGTAPSIGTITLADNPTNGGVTKIGGGVVTFTSAASTYSGPTNINGGTVVITNSANLGVGGAVNINNGSTLQVNGVVNFDNARTLNPGSGGNVDITAGNVLTVPGTIAAGTLNLIGQGSLKANGPIHATINVNSGTFGGTGTADQPVIVAGGAGIDLSDHQLGTLTLSNGLTVNGGTLKFDIGGLSNAADLIALGSSAFNNSGSTAISFNNGGINPGTYPLMTFTNGSAPSGLSLASANLGASTATLNVSSTGVSVTVVGAPIPALAFWTGANGAAWGALTSGSITNFNTGAANNTNTFQTPGAITDVVFGTTTPSAQNLATTLDQDYTIKSLKVSSTAGAVSIDGPGILTLLGGGLTAEAGSGGLTISAPVIIAASQTWNNGSTTPMTISGNVSGTGTITMTGNIALTGTNSYVGGTNIDGGTITMASPTSIGASGNALSFGAGGGLLTLNGNPVTVSSLNGGSNGIIENGGTGNSLITVNTTAVNTYNGTIRDGATGTVALTQIGNGTLTLGGNNTITGNVIVRSGKMILTGAVNTTPLFNVADTPGQIASVTLNGGSITANGVSIGSAGTSGLITMNAGVITSTGELWPGTTNNGYGALLMNGGTVNLANWLSVARSGAGIAGIGIYNMTGGDMEVTVNNAAIGAYNNGGATDGVFKVSATISGGLLHAVNQVWFSENVPSATTLTGNGLINADVGAVIAQTDLPANAALNFGIFNLSGGTLTTGFLRGGTNSGASGFNAHGGVLRPGAAAQAGTFMQSITNAYLWADGGLVLDDAGTALTIPQVLKAPTGNGVASITLSTATLGGYIAPPLITIASPNGTSGASNSATAIGNIDSSGNLTSITVTNPGVGYTSAPTVTISAGPGGGGALTAPTATAVLAANQSGGINKQGTGTVTLSGANTFTGPSTIAAGTLIFSGNSSVGSMTGAGNLTIASGASVTTTGVTVSGLWTISGTQGIAAGSGNAGTSKVTNVPTIASTVNGSTQTFTGVLNLADNRLLVQATDSTDKATKIGTLLTMIKAGSNGGTWTGKGITSSSAAAAASANTVGIFDNASLGLATIGGLPADNNTIMVAVVHNGDANRNGIVDIQDQSIVTNHWQSAQNNFAAGDLNGDGFVDLQDLTLVTNNWQASSNFNQSVSLLSAPSGGGNVSNVPEPASLALLAVGGAALLARRRRK